MIKIKTKALKAALASARPFLPTWPQIALAWRFYALVAVLATLGGGVAAVGIMLWATQI